MNVPEPLVRPSVASYVATAECIDTKQELRNDQNLAAEHFRFVMEPWQCLSSLADPRAPIPPRDDKEQAIRWSGEDLSIRTGAMPFSVRSTDMVLLYQK